MNETFFEIISPHNANVSIAALPGHFVTSHSHINYFIDISKIKHCHTMAKEAAGVLAARYVNSTTIDTIVCMDGSDVLGAFLADELSNPTIMSMNRHKSIHVIPPEFNANGQMIFRDNLQEMVMNRNILLLIASVTTGKTIKRSLECINYYGGNVVGISAVFTAIPEADGIAIHSLFTAEDIPNYHTYSFRDCPDCKAGKKIDALVNSYGYSEI